MDKFRLECIELERCLGTPVQEMSPEDQESLRELVNEFGQNRDVAKKDRDTIAQGFIDAARPVLEKLVGQLLPGALAQIGPKDSMSRVDKHAISAQARVSEEKPTSSAPTENAVAKEQKQNTDARDVDEPMNANTTRGASTDKPQVPTMSAAEAADASMVDQALRLNEGPVPMEVDSEKQVGSAPFTDVPLAEQRVAQSASVPSTEVQTQQLPNAEQPAPDPGTTTQQDMTAAETQSERRVPAVRRLRILESGLEAVSTTTDELAKKVERLEEQVLYQEEQLNDYLDTRGLMEAQQLVEGKKTVPPAVPPRAASPVLSIPSAVPPTVEPPPRIPAEPTPVHSVDPSSMVNLATVEAAREEAGRVIDERFEALAKAQDLRLAELANLQEARLLSLGNEIRSEIQAEAARAEEAYTAAEEKAAMFEAQLAKLQAELARFQQDRQQIEVVIKKQDNADQLIDAIRQSTLRAGVTARETTAQLNTQLQTHDTRLSELDTRVADHTTRLAEHDKQIAVMSPFEKTKEAWRSDMIDMKNHVVGRVDYLEDQVESIKKPLVAARLATETVEQAPAARERTSSPAQSSAQQRQLTPQAATAAPTLSLSTSAPALPLPGLTMPSQGRASPVEGITNRLSLNRMAGLSPAPNSPAPSTQTQPPAANRPRLPGFTAALDRPHGTVNGPLGMSPLAQSQQRPPWPGPSNAPLQTQSGPPRTNGYPVDMDATPDSVLANRLYTSQQQRPETAQGALPLHLRMHNGPGAATGNWMQGGQPAQPVPGSLASTGRQSPATSEPAPGASLLSRMYDPGESKPTP